MDHTSTREKGDKNFKAGWGQANLSSLKSFNPLMLGGFQPPYPPRVFLETNTKLNTYN